MNWIRLIAMITMLSPPLICHSSRADSQIMATEATPAIVFDYVPPYGSNDNLTGHVTNVTPADYRVAVFIYTNSWWTKPYFEESDRLVTINPDSTWTCSITTGQGDEMATRIAAYLLPAGYMPPLSQGYQEIPAEVSQHAVANVQVTRTNPELPREIGFSGLKWTVKKSEFLVGPPSAGNYFSASTDDVWVDQLGRLHLRISNHNGRWYCSEVIGKDSLGYGTYRFVIDNDPAAIDYNAVFGLFTWDDTAPSPYREIDIEFSRWGIPTDPNAQYVLMPYDLPNHRHRYNLPSLAGTSTHSMTWSQNAIAFSSYTGSTQLQSWTYTGTGIPTPGAEKPRINIWLVGGSTVPPSNNAAIEVIVRRFEFVPEQQTSVTLNPTINQWKGALTDRLFHIQVSGTNVSKSYDVRAQSDGMIPLGVLPQQPMTVDITARPFLKRAIQITPSGSEQIVPISLLSGDADGNGLVNLFDYVELDIHFSSSEPLADMDGTGSVNLFDYVVLDQNFGAQAD